MSGDYTRLSFKPENNFAEVLMQQGRVMLDADWNELVEILERRLRATMLDIVGPAIVPLETPDGFKIEIDGNDLKIHPGRIYVHGLLAENHGTGTAQKMNRLGERPGSEPIQYMKQPYYPDAPTPLPTTFPYLVYLDVWQRTMTAAEDQELVEKAIGVDTATRLQTVWQVRTLSGIDSNAVCAMFDDDFFAKQKAAKPSDGRLSTKAGATPENADPCTLSATGGYRGKENRLYRVEIHTGGPLGTATFKWSRDNASLASAVTAIDTTRKELTLSSLGRDAVRCFSKDNWVEISNDGIEFKGEPGELRKIDADPDQVNRTITLNSALSPKRFNITNLTHQHTRVRRWDSAGAITVTTAPVILEDGVEITFSLDPTATAGEFHTGDFWLFYARTADGSVEELTKAPPRGILHHYCPLALVTSTTALTDCRSFWPPSCAESDCDCTVCVTPELHNSGKATIRNAIDTVQKTGGKICLASGWYVLNEPLVIENARAVHIVGKGDNTILFNPTLTEPALTIKNSQNITIERVGFVSNVGIVIAKNTRDVIVDAVNIVTLTWGIGIGGSSDITIQNSHILTWDLPVQGGFGIGLRNVVGVTVCQCSVQPFDQQQKTWVESAIALEGIVAGLTLRDNALTAGTGIASMASAPDETSLRWLLTSGLYIEDNLIACRRTGILLEGWSVHVADTRIAKNLIDGPTIAGVRATGIVLSTLVAASRLDIDANLIRVNGIGSGIEVGTDNTRIINNDISTVKDATGVRNGITLLPGLLNSPTNAAAERSSLEGIERCQIIGNRITGMAGHGIYILGGTHVRSAMIKQNIIDGVGGGGILMEVSGRSGGSADDLTIENNQLLHIGLTAGVAGIGLFRVGQANVIGNRLIGPDTTTDNSYRGVAIEIVDCSSIRIAANEVTDLMAATATNQHAMAAILVRSAYRLEFKRVEIIDNRVRQAEQKRTPRSSWCALWIAGSTPNQERAQPVVQSAAIRGNLLEVSGNISVARIEVADVCLFSDNRCYATTTEGAQKVEISADAASVNGNYLEGNVLLNVVDTKRLTVVSNIVKGKISPPLQSPWAQLNVSI